MECFGGLEHPRIGRCKRHRLLDIVTIAIGAADDGADSRGRVEMFGKSKVDWFRTFLSRPGDAKGTAQSRFQGQSR